MPADADHRLIGAGEDRLVPVARQIVARVVEERRVLGARDRIHRHLECVDADTVDRPLVILSGVAAHQELAGGNRARIVPFMAAAALSCDGGRTCARIDR